MAGSRTDDEAATDTPTRSDVLDDERVAGGLVIADEDEAAGAVAEQVRVLAAIEGRAAGAVVRDALAAHLERRRADPNFRRLLMETRARHEDLLRDFERRETQR